MKEVIKKMKENIKSHKDSILKLNNDLKKEYFSIFDDSQVIQSIPRRLEKSQNYSREESWPSWPCQFIYSEDYPALKEDSDSWEFLKEYLQENFSIYVENEGESCESFILSCGPSILIQDDGNIWDQDSDRIIAEKKDYSTEEERNRIIESYMEDSGCFPGVFETDYYGDIIGPVDTRSKK